ncbi:uncharacterized protein ACB058_020129 [Synchiropus picturatus]
MPSLWILCIFAWLTAVTPALSQSGDGAWGSGMAEDNETSPVTAGDEPQQTGSSIWAAAVTPSPTLIHHPHPQDKCSLHFSTCGTTARSLREQGEEMAHLRALQNGNSEVMENLVQVVGEELGDRRYEDVIKENIVSAQEEQKSCQEVLEKAEEDLKKQLEGEVLDTLAGMHKIKEESSSIEEMIRAAADIAARLESSSQQLHVSFTKPLRDSIKIHG